MNTSHDTADVPDLLEEGSVINKIDEEEELPIEDDSLTLLRLAKDRLAELEEPEENVSHDEENESEQEEEDGQEEEYTDEEYEEEYIYSDEYSVEEEEEEEEGSEDDEVGKCYFFSEQEENITPKDDNRRASTGDIVDQKKQSTKRRSASFGGTRRREDNEELWSLLKQSQDRLNEINNGKHTDESETAEERDFIQESREVVDLLRESKVRLGQQYGDDTNEADEPTLYDEQDKSADENRDTDQNLPLNFLWSATRDALLALDEKVDAIMVSNDNDYEEQTYMNNKSTGKISPKNVTSLGALELWNATRNATRDALVALDEKINVIVTTDVAEHETITTVCYADEDDEELQIEEQGGIANGSYFEEEDEGNSPLSYIWGAIPTWTKGPIVEYI